MLAEAVERLVEAVVSACRGRGRACRVHERTSPSL